MITLESFNQCYKQACQLAKEYDGQVWQVHGYKGNVANGADVRWKNIPKQHWSHYVTVVGDTVYDPTTKQFGLDSTTYDVSELEKNWDHVYRDVHNELLQEKLNILNGPYEDDKQYHGLVTEITHVNPKLVQRRDSFEVNSVSDDVAKSMKFDEPIDVSLFRDGELVCQDGHHRLASAKQHGMDKIPAKLTAINAFGVNINKLINYQNGNQTAITEMPAWNDANKNISTEIHGDMSRIIGKRMGQSFEQKNKFELVTNGGIRCKCILWERSGGRTVLVDVFNRDNDAIGEFCWYNEGPGWRTESVGIVPEYQGMGLAINLYIYMIEKYFQTLYSDSYLTGETGKGSFDVWVRLGKYFPHKYLYDRINKKYKEVDGFTRDMMGNPDISFVVSTKPVASNSLKESLAQALNAIFYEGLIKVPVDEIRQWVETHYDEFVSKLKETLTKGYNTYVEDGLILTNPYNQEKLDLTVEIQKNVMSSSEGGSYFRIDVPNSRILVNATNFYNDYKKDIKSGLVSGLVHEVTHMMDPGVTSMKKQVNLGSYTDRINSDVEFPAMAREFIDQINHLPDENKTKILDRIRKGKALGMKEIDEFMNDLTPENRTKFIKYLYKELVS
jgi:hypothetical protein